MLARLDRFVREGHPLVILSAAAAFGAGLVVLALGVVLVTLALVAGGRP